MAGEELVGRTIADGRYEIVRLLGEGGMGAVYQARQVSMDRMVALKLILPEIVRSPAAAARFHREMKLTAKIEHPNTIRVYDFGETEGRLFLSMELLRGHTLTQALASGPLDLGRLVRIATQVCRALQAAHSEGVVHRDLKPDNVMLLEQYGERDVVKVLDFGIAKSLDQEETGMTTAGAVVGTPAYMSAEQAMGQAVDQRSDLYSLGIMLYEMASGRVPFLASALTALLVAHATETPTPLAQVVPGVHPGLAALIEELLRKDPAERPQTARIIEQRLEALLHGPQAMGPGPMGPTPTLKGPHGPTPTPMGPQGQPMGPTPTPMGPYGQPMGPTPTPMGPHGQRMGPTPGLHGQGSYPPVPPTARVQPKKKSRGGLIALVLIVLVGGGGTQPLVASGSQTAGSSQRSGSQTAGSQTAGSKTGGSQTNGSQTNGSQTSGSQTSGSQTSGSSQSPTVGSGVTVATDTTRLTAAKAKLAELGDPAPPDACPPAAAADAAEAVLAARQAVETDAEKAIELADHALQKCPGTAAADNVRGNALQRTNKLDDAKDAYTRALQIAPDYEGPRFNLGVLQLRRHDPAAITTFTEILKRKPDDPKAYFSRAQANADAKHYDDALSDLEEALHRKPDEGKAWLMLGDLRTALKKKNAREAYCKAAELGIQPAAKRCK
jgi:serine/threonine-protein kinase